MSIENTFVDGFSIGVIAAFLALMITVFAYWYIQDKLNDLERDMKKYMRENYERKSD